MSPEQICRGARPGDASACLGMQSVSACCDAPLPNTFLQDREERRSKRALGKTGEERRGGGRVCAALLGGAKIALRDENHRNKHSCYGSLFQGPGRERPANEKRERRAIVGHMQGTVDRKLGGERAELMGGKGA